jgi:hypothetical protein
MQVTLNQATDLLGVLGIRIVAAIVVLIVGLLIALILKAITRGLFRRTTLDDRLAAWMAGDDEAKSDVDSANILGNVVFWLVMIFVVIAFFSVLNLTVVTDPLKGFLDQIFQYLPNLLGAAALALVAWAVATGLKWVVLKGLGALKVDERLNSEAGVEGEQVSVTKSIAEAVYWLVWLLFLPMILTALGLLGLLGPIQNLVDELLLALPNLLKAGLILAVGWFVARVAQRLVASLLAAVGLDRLSDRVGLTSVLGSQTLSALVGLIVYFMILILALIEALEALELRAITVPASNMLDKALAAVPNIIAAAILLVIAYVIARVVAGLITNLLTAVGFNAILVPLGLGKEPAEGQRTPSEIVGYLALILIMFFASIEALGLLGFNAVAVLLSGFLVFAAQVILGLIIFGVGLWLAKLAADVIQKSNVTQAGLLALAARVAILILAGAMALRQMGLANEIINLAFGLLLGAIAVAIGLAFGLGGREMAARQLESWRQSIEEPNDG